VDTLFIKPAPFGVVRNWLGCQVIEHLLHYLKLNESLFEESTIYIKANIIDRMKRRSSTLPEMNSLVKEIELNTKMNDMLPTMFERLGNTPFIPSQFEFEMVAHGDGAFFSRHIDTFTQKKGLTSNRIISSVYYFHAPPKAFSGGALRLHSLSAGHQQATFIDIEPEHDTLVFFSSWFPHEVLPVHVPSGRFMDSRFAINCWIHRASQQAIAPAIRGSSS
jgi:Rps23 Pro-64 3,4-dihydroxylase Tpa1-like proline 4-hydroxylase